MSNYQQMKQALAVEIVKSQEKSQEIEKQIDLLLERINKTIDSILEDE